MNRVTVRILQRDGCELRVTMPERDYEFLIERWLELCFRGRGGRIEVPAPPPAGQSNPVLVPLPVEEVESIEALEFSSGEGAPEPGENV